MQLPVENFPILTPGQMNPFHQALQSGLENYQTNMKTAYTPYALQADIASKQAYAQNLQRQIAAQALSSPAAATMSNDQITNLLNMIQGGGSQGQMVGLPGQSNGPGGGLIDWLKSLGEGSQTANQAAAPMTSQSPANNNPAPTQQTGSTGAGVNSGYSFNPDGTNTVASPAEQKSVADKGAGFNAEDNYADNAANITNQTPPISSNQVAQNLRNRSQLQQTGSVMTGGGKGVGQGTTYVDPKTGNTYSSLESKNVAPTQASILATQRVAPYLGNLAENYEKSFGLAHGVEAGFEGLESFLTGGNVNTPHLSAFAQTTADRKAASEALIRDFALNATGGNREALEDMLKNAPGESPDSYSDRLKWIYNTFKTRDKAGRDALLKGIRLNPNVAATPSGRDMLATTTSPTVKPTANSPTVRNIGGTTFHKLKDGKWYPYLGDQ
jgi:hypothetical protein